AVFDRRAKSARNTHLAVPTLMMALGLLIGGSVLIFDVAWIGGQSGFGWHQQMAVVVGALLILIGALLRIDVIGLIGALSLVLAACGDFIGMGGPPGVPWTQCILVGGAALLAATGLVIRRFQKPDEREARAGPGDYQTTSELAGNS